MLIHEEIKDIIEDSPFNRLVLAEMERERLYATFVLVDEFNEIASSWLEFSDFCSKSLFNLANLAFLLYQRYLDEFNRDKQQIEMNIERKRFIINRIENLQQFQMETAILMILYADIVNTGIFQSPPSKSYCFLNIEGYKVLENISSTYFDSTHPRSSSIEDIMLKMYTISQKVQIINILEKSPIKEQEHNRIIQEQLELENLLADFEHKQISKLILELGHRWWWHDPIAIHFVFERAMKHLERSLSLLDFSKENVSQTKEEIELKYESIDKLLRNETLIDHFFRITLEAAKKDNFVACIEYLNLLIGLTDEILDYSKNKVSDIEVEELVEKIKEKKSEFESLQSIAQLSFSVGEIINKQSSLSKKSLEDKLESIERKCHNTTIFDITKFYSEIIYVYQSFVHVTKIGLLEKKNIELVLKEGMVQFERFISTLEQNLNKIAHEFYKKVHNGGKVNFDTYLKQINRLKFVSYFLPNLEQKLNLTKEVESMECYIRSIMVLDKTRSLELSEIETLIYYSKAHYFSNKALELSQSKEKEIIPAAWLEKQFAQTFTEGRETERKLFELSRQFLFLNKVIDEIASCFDVFEQDEQGTEDYEETMKYHFKKFELFEIINRQIAQNCLETLKYKNITSDFSIFDEEKINWQIIEVKKILSSATDLLLKSLKKSALAYAADKKQDKYKSAVFLNEGYKLVQEACNILEPLATIDEQFADLVKSTYEFNLFLKELERLELENKKVKPFPLEKVLALIKRIIFFA